MAVIIMNPALMKNKATLEAALNEGSCKIYEPSIMDSWTKAARDIPVGFKGVATRMPARDKFIAIERTAGGWKAR